MKKFYLSLFLLTATMSFGQFVTTTYRGAFAPAPTPMWTDSWTEFDPINKVYPTPNVIVSGDITVNTTWTTGNTYELRGQVFVTNNATLTIQPGVVVRAFGGRGASAVSTGLFVNRGAKLVAEGTALAPIVFTSNETVGNRVRGDWGGITLMGRGAYNINGGVNNIEGVTVDPANVGRTQFGGGATPDNTDNSGVLKYVRIEFAGFTLTTGSELNSLTMGAIGSGTTIDYVQCSYGNDDSFEWFGGSVNCSHLVAFNGLDDDFDADNGYNGSVQFCLAIKQPASADVSDSNCFEVDNFNPGTPGGSLFTSPTFSNCTLVGPTFRSTLPSGGTLAARHRRGAHLRRNCQIKIHNSIFLDFFDGVVVDGNPTIANAVANTLIFKNNIIAGTTASRIVTKVESPATTFDVAAWFTLNGNTSATASTGLLTIPYNLTDGSIFTGLDYRPATGSAALSGADFSTLSKEEFASNAEFSLRVYPNPTADSFKINFISSSSNDVEVVAYDITGKAVESLNFEYNDINDKQIGNGYAPGVYIISLKQGNINKTVRVIKN